jgi:hypothetical protein
MKRGKAHFWEQSSVHCNKNTTTFPDFFSNARPAPCVDPLSREISYLHNTALEETNFRGKFFLRKNQLMVPVLTTARQKFPAISSEKFNR